MTPNLVGQTFGRLTVLRRIPREATPSGRQPMWECRCSCDGKIVLVNTNHLITGHTKSCGCWAREKVKLPNDEQFKKKCQTPEEHQLSQIFKGMKYRCTTSNPKKGKRYSLRGITVCED